MRSLKTALGLNPPSRKSKIKNVSVSFGQDSDFLPAQVREVEGHLRRAWSPSVAWPQTPLILSIIVEQGQPTNLQILRSSGTSEFDNCAVLGIGRTNIFQQLPSGTQMTVTFEYLPWGKPN